MSSAVMLRRTVSVRGRNCNVHNRYQFWYGQVRVRLLRGSGVLCRTTSPRNPSAPWIAQSCRGVRLLLDQPISPINRAPTMTLVQSAIETTPTTLGQTGPSSASVRIDIRRRTVTVRTTPTSTACIFHQKKGL